jgi:hypothetical protein
MIDSRLKKFWLAELEQSANFLEQLYRSKGGNDDLEFQVEKAIFVGFYAIRKLLESKLLPTSVVSLNWKFTSYPKNKDSNEAKWIRQYNHGEGSEKQLGLEAVCNQFIHSAHFSPFVPDGTFCVGFYFASDNASKRELYYIQLVNVVSIFLSVVNEKKVKLSVQCSDNVLSAK